MIPKIVWQCFKTKNLNSTIANHIKKQKEQNPNWKFELYDDSDIREFISKYYDDNVLDAFNNILSGAGRADFWRYLVLYKFGGVYLDIDSEIIKPLDEWIREDDSCIISKEGAFQLPHLCKYYDFPGVDRSMVQWGMIFEPEHPFLKNTIERVLNNIKNNKGYDLLALTGPIVYTAAIYNTIKEYSAKNISLKYRHIKEYDYNRYLSFCNGEVKAAMYEKNEYWRDVAQHIKTN